MKRLVFVISLALIHLPGANLRAADTTTAEHDWKALFNGKDLTGWKVISADPNSWYVSNGILSFKGKGGGWLSTDREYKDFEVEVQFRLKPGGNSGVFIRTPHEPDPTFNGMEIQLLDETAPLHAKIHSYQRMGSVYGLVPESGNAAKGPGVWQTILIRYEGQKVKVTLNGEKIVDADLTNAHPVDHKEHKGLGRASGYIGLQNHSTPVEFRSVRIRELN